MTARRTARGEPGSGPSRPIRASAAPAAAAGALSSADDVRFVAAQLSQLAETFHQRLQQEAPALDAGAVYARLAEEHRLRGIANQLYFEAGERTLVDATVAQAQVVEALDDARASIERAGQWQHALELLADVL